MQANKKVTAAVAAVMYYIQAEEEAIRMQMAMPAMPQMPVSAPTPAGAPNSWSLNGRQTQMQMRNLMQMRAFRKL